MYEYFYTPTRSQDKKKEIAQYAQIARSQQCDSLKELKSVDSTSPVILECVFSYVPAIRMDKSIRTRVKNGEQVLRTIGADLTNLLKLVEDALQWDKRLAPKGILFKDDKQVVHNGNSRKVWGPRSETIITVIYLPNDSWPPDWNEVYGIEKP